MAMTRKQLVTCASILYLLIAFGLAGYASSRANALSVPIPSILTYFTTALPIISGLFLECGYDLTRRQERRQRLNRGEIKRPPLVILANAVIFIYSTVVITLLGTHAAPPTGLDCGLRERWQSLYSLKEADAIKKIQDAFNCCGFVSSADRAYPFPDKNHTAHACEKRFERYNGCMNAWKAEEQQMAGVLMGVAVMVFIWQILIIVTPTQRDTWLHRVVPNQLSRVLADERGRSSDGPQRAIEYASPGNRYSDRVEEVNEAEDDGNINGIEEGNRRLNGPPDYAEQNHESSIENEWARS